MKNLIFVLCTLLGFATQASTDINIMSFNTRVPVDPEPNNWDARRERIIKVIEKYKPDVIGLQESDSYNMAYVVNKTNYKFHMIDGDFKGMMYNPETVSVERAGEFYYSDTPDDPSNRKLVWGQEYFRTCFWVIFKHKDSGKLFYVFNNHLDYVESSWENSVKLLSQKVADRLFTAIPFFVIGDMNIPETNKNIQYLVSGGAVKMRDTYRELKPIIDNDSTFHDWKGTTDGPKIDFILGGGADFTTIESGIIRDTFDGGYYPTDHYPIYSIIRLE